jgi:hypothetical protein
MEYFVELNLCLLSIVIRWIDCCNPSNSCGIPLVLCPLVIRDVKLEFFQNALDCMKGPDLAQTNVGE